jgi:hypothetical protein
VGQKSEIDGHDGPRRFWHVDGMPKNVWLLGRNLAVPDMCIVDTTPALPRSASVASGTTL